MPAAHRTSRAAAIGAAHGPIRRGSEPLDRDFSMGCTPQHACWLHRLQRLESPGAAYDHNREDHPNTVRLLLHRGTGSRARWQRE